VIGPTPLLDCFRRGEIPADMRMLAARGALTPRAYEQLAILVLLVDDRDGGIREAAESTLARIPVEALQSFLARSDIPVGLREFFADRGVFPAEIPSIESDEPLIDTEPAPEAEEEEDATEPLDADENRATAVARIAKMGFSERLKTAIKGSREMRAILIRDPNKVISTSVLSSPKLTDVEIESFARMTTVPEEVLRIIGNNRIWLKNYSILTCLTRNPKTPIAISLRLMNRLSDRDLTMLSVDRNVPDPLRIAARRKVVASVSKK
jgi:hypothetical protein